jgi:membrane fusion protein, multidrug efflux system
MKIKLFILLILVSISTVPFICYASSSKSNEAAVFVEVSPVQFQPFKKHITIAGSLRAHQSTVIRSEISGKITQIYFNSGSFVSAGTSLVQLDKKILEAHLQQNQTKLQLAKQNYQRMIKLYSTHDISKAEYDNVLANYNEAISTVKESQAQLNQALLAAPFSGRLGLAAVNLGDYVEVGQKIVSLQMNDPIEVEFNIPETYLGSLCVGQNIMLTTESYPKQIFTGKIYAIDAEINVNTRSVAVRAAIPNSDNKLLPGGFAEVSLDLISKISVLLIPQTAIFYDVDQTYVYKVVQNKVVKTRVALGERDRENVAVLGGLNTNDVVVTAGQLNINDGSDVKILPSGK